MKRIFIILVLILFTLQTTVFTDEEEVVIPGSIRNNHFFTESLRLNNLARLAYIAGNYLDSTQFSQEAIRYAELSDAYVLMRLRLMEVDVAINAARQRLTFAATVDAQTRFPADYNQAQAAFGEAISYRAAEMWDDSIASANQVLALLAHLDAVPGAPGVFPLPSQHIVRPWVTYGDSLWDIAGRPWVYNNPWEWRRLFEANRDRMPDPNNPDLIEPGMVLIIPPIRGEVRQGTWEPGRMYQPLP